MAASSQEIAFRWWSSLQSTRKVGELDGFGFPNKAGVSSEVPAFEAAWSDSSSSETSSKQKNPHWFFDEHGTDGHSHPSNEESAPKKMVWNEKDEAMLDRILNAKSYSSKIDLEFKKTVWTKKDDAMLDKLLNESLPTEDLEPKETVCNEKDDTTLDEPLNDCNTLLGEEYDIPDLQWSYSFEEPSWEFAKSDGKELSSQEETFFSQEFRWDEAMFFNTEEAFSKASIDSGSYFTDEFSDYYDDDLSTLTPVSGIVSIESSASSEEENNWYRAKIASFCVPRKRPVCKMSQDDLEVWPMNQVPSPPTPETPLLTPLLARVSPDELARRMSVMQQRKSKQAAMEHLAKSKDPKLRKNAQDQLKEIWITAYKKKSRKSGGGFDSSEKSESLFSVSDEVPIS